ncbi:Uncharacterized protein PBTT_10390 [Plasmodiophora brassicae]
MAFAFANIDVWHARALSDAAPAPPRAPTPTPTAGVVHRPTTKRPRPRKQSGVKGSGDVAQGVAKKRQRTSRRPVVVVDDRGSAAYPFGHVPVQVEFPEPPACLLDLLDKAYPPPPATNDADDKVVLATVVLATVVVPQHGHPGGQSSSTRSCPSATPGATGTGGHPAVPSSSTDDRNSAVYPFGHIPVQIGFPEQPACLLAQVDGACPPPTTTTSSATVEETVLASGCVSRRCRPEPMRTRPVPANGRAVRNGRVPSWPAAPARH